MLSILSGHWPPRFELVDIPVSGQDLGGLESLVTGSTHGDGPGTLVLLFLKGVGLTSEQK